ncbi:MAG: hypothetical protein IJV31_00045 [Clostridia bacterium]|nr:hypothetical protein [Clostridia bacterium]
MASNSKSTNLWAPGSSTYPYTLESAFTETGETSIPNNTKPVYARATLSAPNISYSSTNGGTESIYWHDNRSNVDTLIASAYINSCGMGYGSQTVDGYISPTHKDDGTLSGYSYAYFTKNKSLQWIPASGGVATDWTALTFIARTSIPTLSVSEQNVGESVTISTNRSSTSFTHKLYYSIGNINETCLASGITDSYTWTIPKTIANQITANDNGTIKFKLVTVYNGNDIGSKEINLKVKIPNTTEFKPSISSVTLEDTITKPSGITDFVENISKIKGTVHAGGAYGSTITTYSISFNNESFNASPFTTSLAIYNPTLSVTVKDTRGRTATYTQNVTVRQYSQPKISNFNILRDSVDESFFNLFSLIEAYYFNSTSEIVAELHYKKSTDNNYTTVILNQQDFDDITTTAIKLTLENLFDVITSDVNSSYYAYLVVKDVFNTTGVQTNVVYIPSAFKLINISASKRELAIGKLHELAGYLEIALPQANYENIYRKDGTYNGVVLSCPDIEDGKIIYNSSSKKLEVDISGVTYEISLQQKS